MVFLGLFGELVDRLGLSIFLGIGLVWFLVYCVCW